MVIKKLYLKGYDRLFLNNIKEIEYVPTEKTQMIIGSNGCGKSSLISQLTPLPANLKKDYLDGGGKKIWIEHNGDSYILESGLEKGTKHSFLLNNVEKNQSGTKRIQEQLVKEYFSITNDIQNVLIGLNAFTKMSTNERKKWFMNISTVDYTYPISVYNKLKGRHRDILGGIKILENKLLKEETLLLEESQVVKTKEDIKHLKEMLDILIDSKDNTLARIPIMDDGELTRDSDRIMRILRDLEEHKEIDLKNLDELVRNIEDKATSFLSNKRKVEDELLTLSNLLEDSLGVGEEDKFVEERQVYLELKTKIEESNKYKLQLDSIEDISDSYENIYDDLITHLEFLNGKSVDSVVASKTEQALREVNVDVTVLEQSMQVLFNKKHILEETNKNSKECNRCGNIVHFGAFDPEELKRVTNDIDNLEKTLSQKTKYSNELTIKVKEYEEVKTSFNYLVNLIKSNLLLKDIWLYLGFRTTAITVTDDTLSKANDLYEDLKLFIKYKTVTREIDKFNVILDKIKIRKEATANGKKERLEYLKNELNKFNKTLLTIREQFNLIKGLEKKVTEIKERRSNLSKNYRKSRELLEINITAVKNNALNEMIVFFKSEIDILETKLYNVNFTKDKIKDLKKEIEDLQKREMIILNMLKELSPTEGLIAESISSFINVFVKDMNGVINRIWSYPLVVQECKVDSHSNDLDYKFGVVVDDRKPIEDVSKTSASMNEIINLAFKIVSMKYLGLKDYPLVLDEFGITMDSQHRIKSYDIIDVLTASDFSQVFMVSHFESMYGRFTNAQILVLSDSNLFLEDSITFNQHVTINKGN